MKKLQLLTLLLFCATHLMAQKTVYIPTEWRNRTDTLIYAETDTENKYTWSKSRSKESDNVIVMWDKYYGNTIPTNAPSTYRVDIDDLLKKCEAFYELEINQLGFVDPENSNISKYKVMVLLNHTTEWVCYGSGYDYQVPALWLSPSTCKPVGQAVAHEVGHSFHYMCYSEASNHGATAGIHTGFHTAIGNGATIWEQTAQWQSLQSYPELMYDQSIGVFCNSHNYAFTHEWHRYQSYWFLYYLCQYYNDIRTVANVWNQPETKASDFNQALMDLKGLSVSDLYKLYFDYACRMATWDLDVCEPYRDSYIGYFNYRCVLTNEGKYRVALASAPQSTGFNVIPLEMADAGTTITTHFTALSYKDSLAVGDPAEYLDGNTSFVKADMQKYNILNGAYRGFRLGYVALMNDGTRQYFSQDSIYCTGAAKKTEDVSFVVPENAKRLWLVVSPAPKRYFQHKWDESFPSGDDQWPYELQFEGTDIGPSAVVYASPTLDGRDIADVTFTYDLTIPFSSAYYTGTTVTVSGKAASTLGTAFQLTTSDINSKMQSYSTSGPSAGRIMFYALNSDQTLAASKSTANGYGHWFNANGTVDSWSNGYMFSEFTPSTLTFSIGQYPNKCSVGSTYTIGQALKYKDSKGQTAIARFIFNVKVASSSAAASSSLSEIDYEGGTADGIHQLQSSNTDIRGIYDLSGRRISHPQKGLYIVNGKKMVIK